MRLARSLIPVETQLWRQEMKEMRDARAHGRTSIMTFSLAVSERWQKDWKKTQKKPKKNESKKHFQKPKTRKKPDKKTKNNLPPSELDYYHYYFFFGGVFRNVPWTQNLTTVQKKQKKQKNKKKQKKPSAFWVGLLFFLLKCFLFVFVDFFLWFYLSGIFQYLLGCRLHHTS